LSRFIVFSPVFGEAAQIPERRTEKLALVTVGEEAEQFESLAFVPSGELRLPAPTSPPA
jgi:hypothetical protein